MEVEVAFGKGGVKTLLGSLYTVHCLKHFTAWSSDTWDVCQFPICFDLGSFTASYSSLGDRRRAAGSEILDFAVLIDDGCCH